MVTIAYVLAARHSGEIASLVAAGNHPEAEYTRFLSRNESTRLFHYDMEDGFKRRPASYFPRNGGLNWSLASYAAAKAGSYAGFVCAGEDIGLPLAALCWLRRRKQPVYVITHGSYFGSDKFRRLMGILRRNRHLHFFCLSESLRAALVNEFGVRAENAHNTSYGIDTRFFSPSADVKPGPRPLIAAAGTATRDYATLVDAARDLDADVHIAADSAWFRQPVNLEGREAPPNVTIESCGDYVGLRDLYARASFVVVPLRSARHACGYAVIAEAMAMGKAVITTRTPAPSDFVVDGETGFYVRPGDAEDLKEKMDALLCEPQLAREMGRRARMRIERDYSLDAYCGRMESVINGGRTAA